MSVILVGDTMGWNTSTQMFTYFIYEYSMRVNLRGFIPTIGGKI